MKRIKIIRVKARAKETKVIPYFEALEICRDAEQVNFITGVREYNGRGTYCDLSYVFKKGKKYFLVRDCGKIVYCKEL